MRPAQPCQLKRSAPLIWAAMLMLAVGCASVGPELEIEEIEFAATAQPQQANPWLNWPLHADEFARIMEREAIVVDSAEAAGAGTTGVKKLKVRRQGSQQQFKVKWKDVPPDLDGINNAPRKELAAYEIQKLFLDPEYFVVPPSLLRCITEEEAGNQLKRKFLGARCNLGVVSLWLRDVTVPKLVYDAERFKSDSEYAYYLGIFNILTYLMDHKDGRAGNFLVNKSEKPRRIYSIDNGVAFQKWPFYNWFVPNWTNIHIPILPRSAVDRLREVKRKQVEALGVVAQLELASDGVFRLVDPSRNLEPSEGARRRGSVLQFGLTDSEIETVWDRIRDLIADVDNGDIAVF